MAMYTRLPSLSKEWLILRRTETRWNKNASWAKVDEKLYPTSDPTTGWTNKSKRTGLLAVKLGMFTDMDDWGNLHPLTVLQVQDCQVMAIMTQEKNGYDGLQLGAGDQQTKRVGKSVLGQFAKADVLPKRRIQEFRITPDAAIPVGTTLSARHFVPGQTIDVCGMTQGKGFQGAMKRWGFGGLPATHGVSLTHRSLGATGARQDPGKVWKGKKMHGHMGNERVTTQNLKVYQVDLVTNTIAVIGCVPGSTEGWVRVTDSHKHKWEEPPPFPTYTVTGQEQPVFRMKMSKPRPIIEDADEENRTWGETLNSKFPLKISAQLQKRWEQARVEYKEDLEHGRLLRVLQDKFPEALPVEEDVQEWKKRLLEEKNAAIMKKQAQQMKQPLYRRNAENEKQQKLEKAAKKQAQQQ